MGTAASDQLLVNLDLEPIMVKAMDRDEGYGWSLEYCYAIANEYRKYLVLCLEYPDDPIVPSISIDDFWHLHILDTEKYADDCMRFFGYFLHHFPYFGMRSVADAANLTRAWFATRDIYTQRFGTIPEEYWPASNRCPNCGKKCKKASPFESDERPRLGTVMASISH